MKRSQTSDRISSLAASYARITAADIRHRVGQAEDEVLAADIRSMAASLLRQDETKGLRGLVRKALGR